MRRALPPDVAEVLLGSIAARHKPEQCAALTKDLFVFYLSDRVSPGADQRLTCAQTQESLNRLLGGAIALLDAELTERAEREGRPVQELLHEILLHGVAT